MSNNGEPAIIKTPDVYEVQKNKQLIELLRECKSSVLFEADVVRETSGKHSNDYKMLLNLLTRINATIGES